MSEQSDLATASRWGATWWAPLWEFFVHVMIGTLLFVLIGIPAIGLNYTVSKLENSGVSQFILLGLVGCEYLLFAVDIVFFAVFILRQAWKGLLKLW